MRKPADTTLPLHEPIRERWSPRAFADRPVAPADLAAILEAARWAPSSSNEQPWRFILATRGQPDAFARVLSCLVPANQAWARLAPVLLLTLAHTRFARHDKPNPHAWHDVGLAAATLTLEAMARGIFAHQMAGIERDRIRAEFALPAEVEPVTAIALGHPGEPDSLPPELAQRERAPRTRRPLRETVFAERYGQAAAIDVGAPPA